MHWPYSHPDTILFLRAVHEKFVKKAKNPLILIGGDEVDWHSISFHTPDPALPNPSKELELAIQKLKYLYSLFPNAIVLESNHGSLVYRKQKHHGLPIEAIRTYEDILQAPKGWKWVKEATFTTSLGEWVYAVHGKSSDVLKLSKAEAMSSVQFHFHEKYNLQYWANAKRIHFAMQCGCLSDDKSLAMEYNKLNLHRPINGIGLIVDGVPRLLPMLKDHNNRWIKELR